MRIKTMFIVGIAVLLTIVLMQNRETVKFSFLFADFYISKLAMLLFVSAIAFILGILVGRPKKVKRLGDDPTDNNHDKENTGTLSDEDKDYIS